MQRRSAFFYHPHGVERLFCNHLNGGLPDGLPQVAIQPVLLGLFAAEQLPAVRSGADARTGAQIHGQLIPADRSNQRRTWFNQPRPVGILVPVVQRPRGVKNFVPPERVVVGKG